MNKSITKRKISIFFAAAILLSAFAFQSCKLGYLSIEVLKPADIMLPPSFQHFVLADRTRPEKGHGTQALNALEGLVTGEGVFQDRWGAQDCIEGLRQQLSQTPRYTVTIAAIDTVLKGTGRRQAKPPLDWNIVAKMVGNDTTTALVVLESFDSDINITSVLVQAATATVAAQYRADGNVNIYCMWRIYDLKTKTVVDEYVQNFNQVFSGNGVSPTVAQTNLPTRDNMTQRAGIAGGVQYALRISPQWIWVNRTYYKTGSPVLKQCKALVKQNDWKTATDLWYKETTSSNPKAAERATYNMALASEQLGQLDLALQWANSAAKMGDRRGAQYAAILQDRINQQQRLQQQMQGKKQ